MNDTRKTKAQLVAELAEVRRQRAAARAEPVPIPDAAPNDGGPHPFEVSLTAIVDGLPGLIGYVDRSLTYRFANAGYERWFGLGRDRIIGTSVPQLLGEEGFARSEPYIRRALAGEEVEFAGTMTRADGRVKHSTIRLVPDRSAAGEVAGYYVLVTDVTDRLQAVRDLERERAVHEAESAVRLRIASMDRPEDLGTVVEEISRQLRNLGVDFQDCTVQVVNAEGSDFVSIGRGLPSGEPWNSVVDNLLGDAWILPAGTGEAYPWVIEVWRTGQPRYAPDLRGSGWSLIVSLVDVPFSQGTLAINSTRPNAFTDRDLALLQRFAAVLSAGFQRLLDTGRQRRADEATRVSLAMQRVRNEVLQMRSDEDWKQVLRSFHAEMGQLVPFTRCGINLVDRERGVMAMYMVGSEYEVAEREVPIPAAVQQVLETGTSLYRPNREHPFFGAEMPADIHSVVDAPFAGGTVAINSTSAQAFSRRDLRILEEFCRVMDEAHRLLQDLQERRRLEQEVVRLERLRALGELSAGFCHNFNNILTGVLGPALLLQEMLKDPEALTLAKEISEGAERAGELVRRLNQAVRGDPTGPLYAVSVNAEVKRAIQAVKPYWKSGPKSRRIAIEVVTHLDPVARIAGQASELHELLVNLLLNAVEAMPNGGTITVQTRQLGHEVEVQVRDTGIGMDAATRQRVFEPFFTTKAKIGTGLGLASVQGTVRRWGGSISVASAPGKGTTFTLRLPVWTKSKALAAVAEISAIILPPGRLLVVDDDPAITRLLLRALTPGHQVDCVADGIQALARVTPGRYDAVLIDLGIPGLPGDRVARGIRGIDPAVGTVLITGWPLTSDDARLGLFDFHLEKPFQELNHVRSVVARAVELGRRRRDGLLTRS